MSMLLKNLLAEGKKDKTLYKNDWVSMMQTTSKDGEPYVYSHETRCNGNIVAVLLYERIGKDSWKYGLRKESTPCWGNTPQLSSLTGGVDKGNTPKQTAVIELKEEGGYICKESDLESLGTCRGTKSCDTTYHLFALDVSGLEKVDPTGEDTGDIVWVSDYKAQREIVCPLFYVMFVRLGMG